MNPIIERDIEHLRMRYPQAHALPEKHGAHLVIVPSVLLPKGWNKRICTLLFKAPVGYPWASPENFWVDLPDLQLSEPRLYDHGEGRYVQPYNTYAGNEIPGFPAWNGGTLWLSWKLQSWSPNRDTLYTYQRVCEKRLELIQ